MTPTTNQLTAMIDKFQDLQIDLSNESTAFLSHIMKEIQKRHTPFKDEAFYKELATDCFIRATRDHLNRIEAELKIIREANKVLRGEI